MRITTLFFSSLRLDRPTSRPTPPSRLGPISPHSNPDRLSCYGFRSLQMGGPSLVGVRALHCIHGRCLALHETCLRDSRGVGMGALENMAFRQTTQVPCQMDLPACLTCCRVTTVSPMSLAACRDRLTLKEEPPRSRYLTASFMKPFFQPALLGRSDVQQ